jgi:hypothetical protein
MGLFEYVTVAVSIVLGLGIMRLLDGVRFALLQPARYWVHCLWIATKLLNHAIFWWRLWAGRDTLDWNFGSFMWMLAFPGILYLQSTALVTTNPSAVSSWREHFYSIRVWFFGINLLLVSHVILTSLLLLDAPPFAASNPLLALVAIASIAGIVSERPRVQAAIAVALLLTQVLGFGVLWFQPGVSVA